MNYICIRNKGLIVIEDLYLIGSSTKRGDTSKIGMFGSGWKYALACLLRNDVAIQIFSGKEQIHIGTEDVNHRNNNVKVITINDVKTSMTTDMGPQWELWMAIREIVSNAIDEGDATIEPDSSSVPEDDVTNIYIGVNNKIQKIVDNWEYYFAFDRVPDYTVHYTHDRKNEYINIYIKDAFNNMNIYRKGIRCFNSTSKSNIDINFSDVYISENRLTETYYIKYRLASAISAVNNPELLELLLDEYHRLYMFDDIEPISNDNLIAIEELIRLGKEFTSIGLLSLFGTVVNDAIVLPHGWYVLLVEMKLIEDRMNIILSKGYPTDFVEYPSTSFNKSMLQAVLKTISDSFEVITGKFVQKDDYYRVLDDGKVFVKCDLTESESELAARIIQRTPTRLLSNALANRYKEFSHKTISLGQNPFNKES